LPAGEKIVARAVLVLVLVCSTIALAEGLRRGRDTKEFRQHQQFVVCTIDAQADSAINIRPCPVEVIRGYTPILEHLKYGVFANPRLCEQYQKQRMIR
jgi:hypothetical protein